MQQEAHRWLEQLRKRPPEILSEHDVFRVCQRVKDIFVDENSVQLVDSPVTICGDIHGQFYDLLELFDVGGPIPSTKYIFLGDYVDRGHNSVETLQYLLVLKLCFPSHITLLRGNHECRQVTQIYGFYDECVRKYGNANVWRYCVDVFDYLALAAVVDDRVFCVHGGLSPSVRLIDQLRLIDRVQEIPHEGPFGDLVWSDPEEIEGWAVNPRGAGWLFGRRIVSEFNHLNDMDLIARAHQLAMEGYQYMFPPENSLVTVWSAPNYCYRCGNIAAILRLGPNMSKYFLTFKDAKRHVMIECTISGLEDVCRLLHRYPHTRSSSHQDDCRPHLNVNYLINDHQGQQTTPRKDTRKEQRKSSKTKLTLPTRHEVIEQLDAHPATSWDTQATPDFDLWIDWLESAAHPNLLLHGLGSKRHVLEAFVRSHLRKRYPLIGVLRGYHSNASLREFLVDVLLHLYGLSRTSRAASEPPRLVKDLVTALLEALDTPSAQASTGKPRRRRRSVEGVDALCLVIHSLDALALRPYQDSLAELGHHSRIRLIASVDNYRYPLLWTASQGSRFSFLHLHVPTTHHYTDEIQETWGGAQPPWLDELRGPQAVEQNTVRVALSALAPRHRDLYKCLVKLALTSSTQEHDSWNEISRDDLFRRSQHAMIYSEKSKFDAALQELLDHEIAVEGSHERTLIVPVKREDLTELFPELEDEEESNDDDDGDDDDSPL